jgi:TonB family protein
MHRLHTVGVVLVLAACAALAATDQTSGQGRGVYKLEDGVTPPRPLRMVQPVYTADGLRARIAGIVDVEAVVLPDGSVGDVRIVRSLDATFGLDEEALKAAKQWCFVPGIKDGKPVSVYVFIELTFKPDEPGMWWPPEFPRGGAAPAGDWVSESFERDGIRIKIERLRNWALEQDKNGRWLSVTSDDGTRSLTVSHPRGVLSDVAVTSPLSADTLKEIPQRAARGLRAKRSTAKVEGGGQAYIGARFWLWYVAWLPAGDPAFFGYVPDGSGQTSAGVRLWSFTTTVNHRELTVQCTLARARGASESDKKAEWLMMVPLASMFDALARSVR